jgi:hypothetical protein
MIGGCNGLLSTQFGTQRLQRMSAAEVSEGVGDRDYIEVRALVPSKRTVVHVNEDGERELLSSLAFVGDTTESAVLLMWWYADERPIVNTRHSWIGMVERPPGVADIRRTYDSLGYLLPDTMVSLHLGQSPLPGGIHALIMFFGLATAVGVGYLNHRRERAFTAKTKP